MYIIYIQKRQNEYIFQKFYTKHKAYIQSQLPKKMLNSRLKVSIYFY
ncbi:hypothetical protein CoNPh26_CDS0036 [Staphylococcus phage S-CoN_Ph26]|nr:hypothetical protein CoNPh26_CDS0036 [Staphylococcus phage S-CoN_Ph26]